MCWPTSSAPNSDIKRIPRIADEQRQIAWTDAPCTIGTPLRQVSDALYICAHARSMERITFDGTHYAEKGLKRTVFRSAVERYRFFE